jgi:peptidoglycan LD-endopeptidase LytH
MNSQPDITALLKSYREDFAKVVAFDANKDKITALDLSKNNTAFTRDVYTDMERFSTFIDKTLQTSKSSYLIGGYKEDREMYRRSQLFDKNLPGITSIAEEPRSIHLGTDIWGPVDTKVYAPLGGVVHSFAFNDNFGDYGATIILQHQLDTWNFYTLYGHVSLKDIGRMREGLYISRGEQFAHFGKPEENGHWPAHLHFQVIIDMDNYLGDYPGVCKPSEMGLWLRNSPDPDVILNMNRFLSKTS